MWNYIFPASVIQPQQQNVVTAASSNRIIFKQASNKIKMEITTQYRRQPSLNNKDVCCTVQLFMCCLTIYYIVHHCVIYDKFYVMLTHQDKYSYKGKQHLQFQFLIPSVYSNLFQALVLARNASMTVSLLDYLHVWLFTPCRN